MGLRDRFRRKPAPKPTIEAQRRLVDAIAHVASAPSAKATQELHDALLGGILLLAVQKQPTAIAKKTIAAPMELKKDGEHLLLAFTDINELTAHTTEAVLMTLPAGGIFRLMLDGGYTALLLNPAGTSIELSRDEVQALRARVKPE